MLMLPEGGLHHDPHKQSLRSYLLYTAFSMLIGAALLPLLQSLADSGLREASPVTLAVAGGYLSGSLFTGGRWIARIAGQEHWTEISRTEIYFRCSYLMAAGMMLLICLFLFIPICCVALWQYGQLRK